MTNVRENLLVGVFLPLIVATIVIVGTVKTAFAATEFKNVRETLLTSDNHNRLCRDGRTAVVPREVTKILYGFIPNGWLVLDFIPGASGTEQAFNFFTLDDPFANNPPVDDADKDLQEEAIQQRNTINDGLAILLAEGQGRPAKGFRIADTYSGPLDKLAAFYQDEPSLKITCAKPTSPDIKPPSADDTSLTVRLRGTVADLAVASTAGDKFKAASAAELAFVRNDDDDEDTVDIEAAVAVPVVILEDDYRIQFLPFLHYKQAKTTTRSVRTSDVEVLNLGFQFDYLEQVEGMGPLTSFNVNVQPTGKVDIAQNSDSVGVKAYIVPGLGFSNPNITLGQDNDFLWKSVFLHPKFRFLGEAFYVSDKGSNPAIPNDQAFFGIGAMPELQFSPNTGTLFDKFRLSFKYRYLDLISADIDRTERFESVLSYQLDNEGNSSVALDYTDGQDPDTFQDERKWGATFKMKF